MYKTLLSDFWFFITTSSVLQAITKKAKNVFFIFRELSSWKWIWVISVIRTFFFFKFTGLYSILFISLNIGHVFWVGGTLHVWVIGLFISSLGWNLLLGASPATKLCRETFLPTNINYQKQNPFNLPNSLHDHHWFITMFPENLLHGWLLLIGRGSHVICPCCHSLACIWNISNISKANW